MKSRLTVLKNVADSFCANRPCQSMYCDCMLFWHSQLAGVPREKLIWEKPLSDFLGFMSSRAPSTQVQSLTGATWAKSKLSQLRASTDPCIGWSAQATYRLQLHVLWFEICRLSTEAA